MFFRWLLAVTGKEPVAPPEHGSRFPVVCLSRVAQQDRAAQLIA
jgi:hypothetical protein